MAKENIQVNLNNEGGELTIRHGNAPEIRLPEKVSVAGTISAPADWYEGKNNNGYLFDHANMHVVYDIEDMSIKLVTEDEYSTKGASISGKLNTCSELHSFGINQSIKRSAKALAQFLKMNRSFFVDREECMKIVHALNQLKIRVEKEIEEGNDFRGNKASRFEQNVKTDLALDFTLNMPIFKGFDSKTFKVEILFDVTDAGATYWLESVELKEIQDVHSKAIINKEISRLKHLTIIKK